MSWRELKASARDTVHETFGYAASYTYAAGGDPFDVTVRLHRGVERMGTLENGATVAETRDEIVLLASEVPNPQHGDEIEVTDEGTFIVDHAEPALDGTIVVVVTLDA